MLYFIMVLSVISAVYGDEFEGKSLIHVPQIVVGVLKKAATDCMIQTGVGQDVVDDFFKVKAIPELGTKKFIYCIGRKINYIDEDGRHNGNLAALVANSDQKEAAEKVMEKCNIKRETKYETAFQFIDCFYKNSPVIPIP